ncbi:DUF3139 domain-containing protein [Brevibacillus massiliensis]|jgi:hypothetical protein|uniref:DUF3139 domain-containing protein n=1 Tax=Brevibacillus massiliensis TaxID=1118054 RepID=UPI00035C5277|nr:DUF3139 domain-containing protein [Brevibacillus massiliensis]
MANIMKKIIAITMTIILIGFLYLLISNWEWIVGGYNSKLAQMDKDMREHVVKVHSIKESDIYRTEVFYIRKTGRYYGRLIFNDERGVYYLYVNRDGRIEQSGIGSAEYNGDIDHPKHWE